MCLDSFILLHQAVLLCLLNRQNHSNLNNALRELQLREQREIHRILADLTKQVSEIREPLALSYSTLTELDVIFARGKYSIEICGNPPVISSVPCVKLSNARHPILLQHLKREKTVPLSIEFGENITNTYHHRS